MFKAPLGATDRHPLPRQILPRLRQGPLRGQAVAEEDLRLLFCHMDVPPGGLQLHKKPPGNGFCQFLLFHPVYPSRSRILWVSSSTSSLSGGSGT